MRLARCRKRCKVGKMSRRLACLTAGELARPFESMVQQHWQDTRSRSGSSSTLQVYFSPSVIPSSRSLTFPSLRHASLSPRRHGAVRAAFASEAGVAAGRRCMMIPLLCSPSVRQQHTSMPNSHGSLSSNATALLLASRIASASGWRGGVRAHGAGGARKERRYAHVVQAGGVGFGGGKAGALLLASRIASASGCRAPQHVCYVLSLTPITCSHPSPALTPLHLFSHPFTCSPPSHLQRGVVWCSTKPRMAAAPAAGASYVCYPLSYLSPALHPPAHLLSIHPLTCSPSTLSPALHPPSHLLSIHPLTCSVV
ncbi:unnamed protein product [Closterium sp. Naga37s-1]|nr:unnamed protein product [Closterium sp. Naga37s-1]